MKEYKLKTIEDIIKVVDENNVDNFIKDFTAFLGLCILQKTCNKIEGVITKHEPIFCWIDDGKNDIKINIKIVDK